MSEPNSGIQGMRETLRLALGVLTSRSDTQSSEWVNLTAQYAVLAELEQRAAETQTRDAVGPQNDDDIPDGVPTLWAKYLPWRIMVDKDGDEYAIVGYTHFGMPMLAMIRSHRGTGRGREWDARDIRSVARDYGPLTFTDRYLEG